LGRILRTHYNSKELASELIDGGDMSSAWDDQRWDCPHKCAYGPNYYSYRGEDTPPRHDANIKEYLSKGEEYAYLFVDGEWICYDRHEFSTGIPELVEIPSADLAA
jgi:hypothetical protein